MLFSYHATVSFLTRSYSRFGDAVETIPSSSSDPAYVSYAGLSPFDIPDAIEVEVTAPAQCIFRFAYPNSEPGDSEFRPASRDGTVSVKLGRNTGKVLELLSTNADTSLVHGNVELDLSFVPSWQAQLPWHARNTCRRNAFLVQRILADIPDHFRRQILAALTR